MFERGMESWSKGIKMGSSAHQSINTISAIAKKHGFKKIENGFYKHPSGIAIHHDPKAGTIHIGSGAGRSRRYKAVKMGDLDAHLGRSRSLKSGQDSAILGRHGK